MAPIRGRRPAKRRLHARNVPRSIHPEFQGSRRFLVSNTRVWSVTALRLWNGDSLADVHPNPQIGRRIDIAHELGLEVRLEPRE